VKENDLSEDAAWDGSLIDIVAPLFRRGRAQVPCELDVDAASSSSAVDAQRKAVIDYLDGGQWALLDEFIEVETAASAMIAPSLQETQSEAGVRQAGSAQQQPRVHPDPGGS
jgi:hypothetical protein